MDSSYPNSINWPCLLLTKLPPQGKHIQLSLNHTQVSIILAQDLPADQQATIGRLQQSLQDVEQRVSLDQFEAYRGAIYNWLYRQARYTGRSVILCTQQAKKELLYSSAIFPDATSALDTPFWVGKWVRKKQSITDAAPPSPRGSLPAKGDGYVLFMPQTEESVPSDYWQRVTVHLNNRAPNATEANSLLILRHLRQSFAYTDGLVWVLAPANPVRELKQYLQRPTDYGTGQRVAPDHEQTIGTGLAELRARQLTSSASITGPIVGARGAVQWTPSKIVTASLTKQGQNRTENQDSFRLRLPSSPTADENRLFEERGCLLIVADGVGGGAKGDTASRTAANQIERSYYGARLASGKTSFSSDDVVTTLRQAMLETNDSMTEWNEVRARAERMYTTCVCVVIHGDIAHAVWLGDSQAFLFRQGRPIAATEPSLWHNEGKSGPWVLGDRSANEHIRHTQWRLEPDDTLLMCSDGLTRVLNPNEMASVLHKNIAAYPAGDERPVKISVEKMFRLADTRARSDDTTIVVARRGTPSYTQSLAQKAGLLGDAAVQLPRSSVQTKSRSLLPLALIGAFLVVVLLGIAVLAFRSFSSSSKTEEPTLTVTAINGVTVPTTSVRTPILIKPVIPTATPTPSPTPLPTATPTLPPTATPTPKPTPRPTRPLTSQALKFGSFQLKKPTEDQTFYNDSTDPIHFSWDYDGDKPDGLKFRLRVKYTVQDEVIYNDSKVQPQQVVPPQTFTDGTRFGQFTWQVRAEFNGEPGEWSHKATFRIDAVQHPAGTPTPSATTPPPTPTPTPPK